MFVGALPQFHRHSSHLGVRAILWEFTTWRRFRGALSTTEHLNSRLGPQGEAGDHFSERARK
jgi:hypothetical protein